MTAARDRVVIVGAGMGGLAAAMRLAHAGMAVTLVERHAAPGGKMRCVPSPAGPVDAGPTVLTMRAVFEALFAELGEDLADHVTLTRDAVIARHFWPDGSRLDLYADAARNGDAIAAFAGRGEAERFRRFDARAARLFAAFEHSVIHAPRPDPAALAGQVLRAPGLIGALAPALSLHRKLALAFRDPRLRQLFGRYATYVGGAPDQAPAVLALIWHAEARGVWSVAGGMHQLAQAMARLAEARGARLVYGSGVARIELQGGQVAAAHLESGERLACDRLIFNGDPAALHRGLLGAGVRRAVPRPAVAPRSLSACVWSFAARPEGPELAHHNVFFAANGRDEFGPLKAGRLPDDPTLYICAQDRGGGARPEGPERFEIIMNAPPDPGRFDKEEDETCRRRTFQTLQDRFGLRFDPPPTPAALTTPAGFAALFPASDGSLYGRSPHGLTASFRRPTARTAIPGLYLAGGGVHPGAGVPMATLSGRHAAEAILADRISTSPCRPTAMPGGISTGSATTGSGLSRSSPS